MSVDHTRFKEGAPGTANEDQRSMDRRWWLLDDKSVAASITGVLESLKDQQKAREMQLIIAARLYGNMAIMGQTGTAFRVAASNPWIRERINYNVVQSATDTATARCAKNKPKPLFLTSNGNYAQHRKAKKLNVFTTGIFEEENAYRATMEGGPYRFRDGAVWGDGITKVFSDPPNYKKRRVRFERVLPGELRVDELEALYGIPRQMHQLKDVDKAVLIDCYTKCKTEIEKATHTMYDVAAEKSVSDMVTVRESWHLPSGPDATDGRHVITTEECILLDEKWDRPYFPFARFRWCPRLHGFWSQGGAEQIMPIQLELTKLLGVVQQSFHLAGTFKVFLENGSKIVKEHLNNDIGAIVNYTGTKPEYYVPQIVPPEIFNQIMTLKQLAYEQYGISALAAASEKPAGLNAGVALREFNDIGSDRLATINASYENYFMDLGKLALATVQDICKETGKDYELDAPGRGFNTHLSWEDCNLEPDKYTLQAFPVSSLPNEPAERLQTIQEWVQAEWLSQDDGMELMDFPDLQRVNSLRNATREYLGEVLDKIVDEGIATTLEPFDNLQMARQMGLQYYAEGKLHGLEEKRLQMLRDFLGQVDLIQAAAMPPPQPGAGQPGAVPEPPPVSGLIPNVPGNGVTA